MYVFFPFLLCFGSGGRVHPKNWYRTGFCRSLPWVAQNSKLLKLVFLRLWPHKITIQRIYGMFEPIFICFFAYFLLAMGGRFT